MASKVKFRKLSLGPSDPVTRKNSCEGMSVIADYIDPVTNQRVLVLERPSSELSAPAPAKRAKRAAKKRVAAAQPQTSFDTTVMEAQRG